MNLLAYDAGRWGVGILRSAGADLIHHEEPVPGRSAVDRGAPSPAQHALAARLVDVLAGAVDDFRDVDVGPAVAHAGLTPFGAAVVAAIRGIPRGETASYGEIAILAGRPGAARAVGSICAEGVLPVIVPYHRVIRSDGCIGEYGDGAAGRARKARLLALEGVDAR